MAKTIIGIGTIEAVLKLVFYYFHEKTWERVGIATETIHKDEV